MIVDGKIFGLYQTFYIQSMLFNCQSAARSIDRIDSVFEKLSHKVTEEDLRKLPTHSILNELQNIVIQGAALSRYFWPIRKGHEERGNHLREVFNVNEGNPLQARELRNTIEHFDERLDVYLLSGIVGYIFPEFVGPRPNEDDVAGHFFRAFFVDCGIFRLLDVEYKIEPLMNEILRLGAALQEADSNGSNFPST